jgi:hypothetical protein
MTTTAPTPTEVAMTSEAATLLAGVLEHCEEFLRTRPGVRADLADFCTHRSMVTSGWLIDMLALHALHLRARIDDLDRTHPKDRR